MGFNGIFARSETSERKGTLRFVSGTRAGLSQLPLPEFRGVAEASGRRVVGSLVSGEKR